MTPLPSAAPATFAAPARGGGPGFPGGVVGMGAGPRLGGLPDRCRTLARSAPKTLSGQDKLRFYAEHVARLAAPDREAMKLYFDRFVRKMEELAASDLDMGGNACAGRAWYRVDGDKSPYDEVGSSSNDEIDVLLLNLLGEVQHRELFASHSIDFSYSVDGRDGPRRFRATLYFDFQNLGICLRAINAKVFPLKSLEFHPVIERGMLFEHVRDGLTLVTGVTGSGKSTTLDAVIDANNERTAGHIVVIAKPIEYMHHPKRCLVRHREVGQDVPSFKDGIVQALRQDPDIIVVGEMRDPTTISAALEAADSGHKVFSTLHTSSAVESLDRIVAEYPPVEQERVRNRLADTLRCVVSQKLAPRLGGGRVLVKEVLWITPSVRAAIKSENTGEIYQMIWEGGRMGMITLEQDLARLLKERAVSMETALNYANNKRRLQQLLQ